MFICNTILDTTTDFYDDFYDDDDDADAPCRHEGSCLEVLAALKLCNAHREATATRLRSVGG